jgi:diguanylate cyclase (GGDEF)-like protein
VAPLQQNSRKMILTRLIWLSVLIALGSAAFLVFFYQSFSNSLKTEKKAQSRHQSEVGINIINYFYRQSRDRLMDARKAQHLAMKALESAVYQDNGYFWINNDEGILVMQPYTSDLVGINQFDWTDINGKFIFREFIKTAKAGGGWVDYYWPKPNTEKVYPKISYVAYFEPWNWVLGTGVYLDDMQDNVFRVVAKATGFLLAGYLFCIAAAILAANYFIRQLSEMTIRDPLTRLYTKRFLSEIQPALIRKKERETDLLLAAVFIDIDHFKKINDTYGHARGDHVLKEVAAMMQEAVRPEDVCVRYGGEEFVVVGFFKSRSAVIDCAERIRKKAAKIEFPHKNNSFTITLSAGVAAFRSGQEDFNAFLNRADQRLYQAKREGRNRIVGTDNR